MKLMVIDGNSIINRAFYGIRMLNAPDGTPTNGVYGFLTILGKLIDEDRPDGLCVAFDTKAPTFRHARYDAYKAGRRAMPDELAVQMPVLKEALDAMGVKRCEQEGYEADDLIGAMSRKCEEKGWDCLIVTGDRDSFQLITDRVHVKHVKTRMGQTETIEYDPGVFKQEYGFEPIRMIDLKALMGDASDNIPGVPGVGEKTGLDLIRKFGTLEKIYSELDTLDIRDSLRSKLRSGEESAKMSFELAAIRSDAPLCLEPEDAVIMQSRGPELFSVFKRLGFLKLIEKWGLAPGNDTPGTTAEHSELNEIDVRDEAGLNALYSAVSGAEYVSVLLSDGLNSISVCDGEAVYTANRMTSGDGYDGFLSKLFSEDVKKVSHSIKDMIRALRHDGFEAGGFIFDTALAAYLLEPTQNSYEPRRIAAKYLGGDGNETADIRRLYPVMDAMLKELGQSGLYYDIELPLSYVLADMELCGFAVDRDALESFGLSLNSGIERLQASVWEAAGEEFNISSPKQLGVILFEKLMLPAGKKTKTGWSTNADVLERLRDKHSIVQQVLDYRQLTKLKSTYADGLLKMIEADGRIRTSFQMTVTATGRLSSVEPNLQNIPVRSELGGELRKMFVPAPGKLLIDADYSQIELRLLAHISGDETMKSAFKSGEDIHSFTASQVFGVPLSEVTHMQRSRSKAVNFGIVYGISAFSLAQDIGVSQPEARDYIDAYLSKYHGVRDYMKRIVEQAKEDGYVTTLFGRRRYLPELKSSNFNLRSFGERVALNMPIQGTAADIIKLAMVNVHRRLKREGLSASLILQVHDELIVECPEREAETVLKLLTEEMENAVSYDVPLVVEAHAGRSWYDAK